MKKIKLITKLLLITALITSCSGNVESDGSPLSYGSDDESEYNSDDESEYDEDDYDADAEDETSSTTDDDLSSTLDDYEEFVDEYIVVFKKSMDLSKKMQSGDMSAASEAASISEESMSLMEKVQELENKLEKVKDQMDAADMKRFIKMQTKLAKAATQAM